MRYKVGVVKKITFLFMTIGLAVALVACQGAVGKTGEPGPKGEPGKPAPPAPAANLAPQARSLTFDAMHLREGGDADTVNVVSNFYDPDGDDAALVLSFSVEQTARFVDVALDAGVLTITPVDAGEAVITVTATDAGGLPASATLTVTVVDAGSPMYIGSLSGETLTFGGRQTIPGSVIESSFDGEDLEFSAETEHTTIVDVDMDNPDDPNEVTITALQTEGTATVTITATDEDGDTDSHSIQVEVRASLAPVVTDVMPDPVTLYVGGEPKPVDVAQYFDNHGLEALTYEPTADSEAVSLSDVVDGMLTITPVSADVVVVTITATNMHGPATQTISVTVKATPPMASGTISAQTIAAGGSRSIGLHQYFTPGKGSTHDKLVYTESVEGTAATALISGGDTLVITAGSTAGSATITVTATDGDGETAMQTVMVTVTVEEIVEPPTPNMAPQLKDGETLGPYKGVFNATTVDFHNIDLSKIFVDDRTATALITYKVRVTSEDDGDDDTTNDDVIAVQGENWVSTSGDPNECNAAAVDDKATPLPDGTNFNSKIGVCYQAVGTATIEVIAVDAEGAESTHSVMFTSHSGNHVPTAIAAAPTAIPPTGVIVNVADARLKIGDKIKTVIDQKKFSEFFEDNDFPDTASIGRGSETLTFEVKHYYSTADTTGENIPIALDEGITGLFVDGVMITTDVPTKVESGKEQTRVAVSPTTWTGGRDSTFTVTVEALRGSSTDPAQDDAVAIIATDEFGKSAARVFHVRVNHKPDAYSAHPKVKDRKTLADVTVTKNMTVSATAVPVRLIDDDDATNGIQGYFSDKDDDDLMCRFVENDSGVATIAWADPAARDTLNVTANNVGTMTVDVWCFDRVDTDGDGSGTATDFERSDKATLTVHVEFTGSIHD
jgi:hypothetical protein